MTTYINLWGSPSCGKSTLAAAVFSALKIEGKSVELVTEHAKRFAWQGRKLDAVDQVLVSAAQLADEERLNGKVEYVITDSPSLLGVFYCDYYNQTAFLRESLVSGFERRASVNLVLPRRERYDAAGRFETKAEAVALHEALIRFVAGYCAPKHLKNATIYDVLEAL